MYQRGFEPWLAIYLAQPANRLQYWAMWRRAHLVEYTITFWSWAGRLPKRMCMLVRSKLERALSSGNLLPARACAIRVPCNDPQALRNIRGLFRAYLHHVCKFQPHLFEFL
eukprot:1245765-Pyramimonas_sp.AAC.1